ncbi:hypothetical protein GCM10017710_05570 [Arthrobacter ramosus]
MAKGKLVFWGGGWIAGDRPESKTIRNWVRHLNGPIKEVLGVGLGIGPFLNSTKRHQSDIDHFFGKLSGRISVRTSTDLEHIPNGHSAILGCDVALLDKRFYGDPSYSGSQSDYVIFSFPSYSSHWVASRPWMTERWYLDYVRNLAEDVRRENRIVFAEFDEVRGSISDSSYWSHLPAKVVRLKSMDEATALFSNAKAVYAGRLHAAILGAVIGNPTLALAYHHKFGVTAELGIPSMGLTREPTNLGAPVSADLSILDRVRQRGLVGLTEVGVLSANDS